LAIKLLLKKQQRKIKIKKEKRMTSRSLDAILNESVTWMPYTIPWDDAIVDISFVFAQEKPAGKHGFLGVKGDRFVFGDGTEARFWGTCMSSGANFPPREYAEKVAERLAKFGVNMVRLTQLDVEWSIPNIFQFTKGPTIKDTQSFDPRSMDRLDYFVYCLKQHGIYIYLDQMTHRRFRPGDNADSVDQFPKWEAEGYPGPYTNFDPRLIELQKNLSHSLWTHYNPYTKLTYKEDPVFALTLIANTNDLFWRDVTIEPYRTRFEQMFRQWCAKNEIQVEKEKVDFTKRTEAVTRFSLAVQKSFYREMIKFYRDLGVKIPVTGNNVISPDVWPGLSTAESLLVTDFHDNHVYTGIDFQKVGQENHDTPIAEKNNFQLERLYRGQVLDRPFFVSEWCQPWPNEWRAGFPLFLAALGAFQGWAGLLVHTYRYRNTYPVDHIGGRISGEPYRIVFDTFNDPALFGLFPHAALLYRRGDIEPARKIVGIEIPENDIIKEPSNKGERDLPALHLLAETHKLGLVLPGQNPKPHADRIVSREEVIIDQAVDHVTSDTGQIYRNWEKRFGWIDTPFTKVVYGFLGEQDEISLDGLILKVKTPFATIALSSLTKDPIKESDNLLLTTVGQAKNTNQGANFLEQVGCGPILIEPIEVEVRLTTKFSDLRIYSLDTDSYCSGKLKPVYQDGVLSFTMGKRFPSMYYLVVR
jgi:hypothetical protein